MTHLQDPIPYNTFDVDQVYRSVYGANDAKAAIAELKRLRTLLVVQQPTPSWTAIRVLYRKTVNCDIFANDAVDILAHKTQYSAKILEFISETNYTGTLTAAVEALITARFNFNSTSKKERVDKAASVLLDYISSLLITYQVFDQFIGFYHEHKSYLDKIAKEMESDQSKVSMIVTRLRPLFSK